MYSIAFSSLSLCPLSVSLSHLSLPLSLVLLPLMCLCDDRLYGGIIGGIEDTREDGNDVVHQMKCRVFHILVMSLTIVTAKSEKKEK